MRTARSAYDAKKIAEANCNKKLSNWSEIKLDIMKNIIRSNLKQHPYIREKLIATQNAEIIENSPKDSFLGWGPNQDGKNHLGKIWMKILAELKVREK